MNPTLLLIIQKNSADIEAIVNAIGVGKLLQLTPQLLRIAATLQAPAVPPEAPAPPGSVSALGQGQPSLGMQQK